MSVDELALLAMEEPPPEEWATPLPGSAFVEHGDGRRKVPRRVRDERYMLAADARQAAAVAAAAAAAADGRAARDAAARVAALPLLEEGPPIPTQPLHLYNLPPLPLPAGTDEPPVAHVDQYICTGYDVYLSVEPCAMDAMALSHARVRSVVFAARDPIDGALLSRLRLHEARPLNHHYSVFQMREDSELAKEAASLWDEGDEIGVGDPFSSRLPKAGVRAGSSP